MKAITSWFKKGISGNNDVDDDISQIPGGSGTSPPPPRIDDLFIGGVNYYDEEDEGYWSGGSGFPDMQALILDLGSSKSKCGYSGDDEPRVVFPTIVGRPKNQKVLFFKDDDCHVGDEAVLKQGVLDLKSTIVRGCCPIWRNLEKLLHHTFYNELRVTPEEHPTLMTEPIYNKKEDREKLTSIMFETFNVPSFYLALQSTLGLYSSGRTTGVTVDIGHGLVQVVPTYEGFPIQQASSLMKLSGEDITNNIMKFLIEQKGVDENLSREAAIEIKENHCFVDCLVSSEHNDEKTTTTDFELPDGSKIQLSKSELSQPPEILFNPSIIGKSSYDDGFPGIPKMIRNSQIVMDKVMQDEIYKNIVLSGGSRMFRGFKDRLEEESLKHNTKIKILNPKEKFSVWIGGSILSSLSTFQNMWITKDEYDDHGATVVHRKCFGGCFGKRGWIKPELREEEVFGDRESRIEYIVEKYFCMGKDDQYQQQQEEEEDEGEQKIVFSEFVSPCVCLIFSSGLKMFVPYLLVSYTS